MGKQVNVRNALVIASCVAVLIASCGGCAAVQDRQNTGRDTRADSMETRKGKENENGKKPQVVLRIFQYAPEMAEQMNDMTKEYNRQFPHVKIDVQILQNDYPAVLKAKLNSGDIPDVFMTDAYNGNKTYRDYCYDLTNEDFMNNIKETALEAVTLDGKILGYPFITQAHSFIYNKKLFESAGIKKLPVTLKEFEEACVRLKSIDITPFATGYKEWWILEQTTTNCMAQVGGDYVKLFDDIDNGRRKFSDIKEAMSVFDWIDLTVKYGEKKPLETDFNTQCVLFAQEKVAMIHQGTWAEDTIRKINPGIDMGFLPFAVGDDPGKAGIMVDSNITYRIYKSSKNLEECINWMRWMITSDYGKALVPEKIKQISTIKGVPTPKAQLCEETMSFIEKRKTYPWVKGYWPDGFEQQLGIELQSYISRGKTKEQVMEELDKTWMMFVKASR